MSSETFRRSTGRTRPFPVAQVGRYVILVLALIFFLGPITLVFANSLRSSVDVSTTPLAFPSRPTLVSYGTAWTTGRFSSYALNSMIYTVSSVCGVIVAGTLAGFGLARIPFRGRGIITVCILLGLIVPLQSYMLPLFYELQDFGLIGTYWAVILPNIATGIPLASIFMRSFFLNVPDTIVEAARLDGCGSVRVFSYIMIPLCRPAVTTLATVLTVQFWNSFLLPLIAAPEDSMRPLALGLRFFSGRFSSDQALISAGAIMTSLPVIIVLLIFQRQFIEGITAGAVRG